MKSVLLPIRHFSLLLVLCTACLAASAQELSPTAVTAETAKSDSKNPREFEMKEGNETFVMKQYYFVLLTRGGSADSFSKEQLEELQAGHMANITKYYEAGKIVLAGPFGDDTDKRGIFIFDTETVEEAEQILKEDPAIQAGRLSYEIHPWWGAKGTTLK